MVSFRDSRELAIHQSKMLKYHTVFVMQLKYNERSFWKGKNILVLYGINRNVLLFSQTTIKK